ncbi:hypothetical protein DMENIID0001_104150 [Sergentomyia squamirostris]
MVVGMMLVYMVTPQMRRLTAKEHVREILTPWARSGRLNKYWIPPQKTQTGCPPNRCVILGHLWPGRRCNG